jgi:hypothetical protein
MLAHDARQDVDRDREARMSKLDWVAACLGAVLAAVLAAASSAILVPLGDRRDVLGVLGSLVVYMPFFLAAEIFVGIPAFAAIVSLKLVRWWCWAPTAALLGFALDIAVGNPASDAEKLKEWMVIALVSAASFRVALALPERMGMRPAAG